MNPGKPLSICLAAFLGSLALEAGAATLYKLIDRDGHVSYSDQPPMGFAGTVVPLDIDPRMNAASSQPPPIVSQAQRGESENERIIRRRPPPVDEGPVRLAQQRLDAAKLALANAQESSTPDDWIYHGYFNGTRRSPRPEYSERLEALDAAVKQAEASLAEAERKLRLGG